MKLSIIRQAFLLIAAIFIGRTAVAQTVPDWYDETSREQNYPDDTYFSGLAYADVTSSEVYAIQMAEQSAKTEALSKILMSIQSQSVLSSVSVAITTDNGFDEQVVEQYSNLTQIDVAFKDVPGMQCQHYRKGRTVTAFAYVKKKDLVRYFDRKITATLTKIETTLDNAEELVRRGEKIKARTMAQSVVQQIAELENAQRILLAVSNYADIQSKESSVLSKRLISVLADLKNSTAIYLDCHAMLQGKPYASFGENVKGELSKLGVNFVSDRYQADWVITIEADVVKENTVYGSYFAWVDGDVSILKKATNQVIYSNTISALESGHPDGIKGGHTAGYEQAIRKAYVEAAQIVAKIVSELINQ